MESMRKTATSQNAKLYWFSQKYELSLGKTLSLDEVLDDFENEKENLNFKLEKKDVRSLVNHVVDNAKSVKLKRNGKRIISFMDIGKRARYTSGEEWKRMQTGVLYSGWLLRSKTENPPVLSFTRLTGVAFDENELAIQLSIDPTTLAFELKTSQGTINGNDLVRVSPANVNILFVLEYLSRFTICCGVQGNEFKASVVRTTEDTLCHTVNVNGRRHFISKKCSLLVLGYEGRCTECIYLNKRLLCRKQEINLKFTKHTLLGKTEMEQKVIQVQREKRNAEKRADYWRQKYENESFAVTDEDHEDFATLLGGVDQTKMNDDMRLLLQQQHMALKRKSKYGYRWHPKIIRLCLDIYTTSSKAFDTLKEHLILPSKRLIRYYKNSVPCSSGWNAEVMAWCQREATKLKMEGKDLWGGLVFDEMTIQEDLEFVRVGGQKRLLGAVNLGKSYEDSRLLTEGTNEPQLASKVMQFALVSDNGFRFNLAHFPVKTMPAVTLHEKFWEGIEHCERIGFRIYWLVCDGGEPNRSFMKMLFPYGSDPEASEFVAENLHTGGRIAVMSDSKHCFKKIRNHLEKSTMAENPTRKLTINNNRIVFEFWKRAFKWDQENHSFPLHEKLTEAHFELDARSRMRNHLAEDVLDKRMLHLMQEYQQHLCNSGQVGEASALNEPINLLEYTSQLIDLFSRKDSLLSTEDPRLKKAKLFLQYLQEWKSNAAVAKEFLSNQLWFDLRAMIIGLHKAVEIKTKKFPGVGIKPVIVNQDVIENTFCQVRGSNGQNSHPKYYMYCSTITSINVGQSVVSRKSNTNGNRDTLPRAGLPKEHPFSTKNRKFKRKLPTT